MSEFFEADVCVCRSSFSACELEDFENDKDFQEWFFNEAIPILVNDFINSILN